MLLTHSHVVPAEFGFDPVFFPSYRKDQFEVAQRIATAEKRVSVLQAPVGSGKSLCYNTVHKIYGGRMLVLVGNKGLQAQLEYDFSHVGLYNISGHRNYGCMYTNGDDAERECPSRDRCQYQPRVELAKQASSLVTNIAHWVSLAKVGDQARLGEFDLLVIDEAHLADQYLTGQLEVEITGYAVEMLGLHWPEMREKAEWREWREWCRQASNRAQTLADKLPKGDKQKKRWERFAAECLRVVEESGDKLPEMRWICRKQEKNPRWRGGRGDRELSYVLQPVWAKRFTEKYLFRGIEKVVLASGTITEQTCEYLGVDLSEVDLIEVESTFDPKRGPFIYLPTVKVDQRMTHGDKRVLYKQVDRLIGDRLDRNGIIHTVSYDRMRETVRMSEFSGLMLSHEQNSEDRQRTIQEYIGRADDPPAVLVSPSVEEGYDFFGDRARYQILLKIPTIYRGDPVIAARLKDDNRYVNYLVAFKIQQMYGRARRSMRDWAETILLDVNWGQWFRKSVKWPLWFRKTWVQADKLPKPLQF